MNSQSKIRFNWLVLAGACFATSTTFLSTNGWGQDIRDLDVNPLRSGSSQRQPIHQNEFPPGVIPVATTPIRTELQANSNAFRGPGDVRESQDSRNPMQESTSRIIPTLPRVDGATLINEPTNDATRAAHVADLPVARVPASNRWTELTSEFLSGTTTNEGNVKLLERQLDNLDTERYANDGDLNNSDLDRRAADLSGAQGTSEITDGSDGAQAKPVTLSKSEQLNELVERVVYYTLIVISLGVGFVAISKIWQAKVASNVDVPAESSDLKVLNSIKLSSKVTLTLVGIGHEKVVVASDHEGVKSVIRIGDDSQSEMDEFRSFEDVMASGDKSAFQEKQSAKERMATPNFDSEIQPRADRYSLDMIGKVLEEATRTEGAEPRRDRNSARPLSASGAEPKSIPSKTAARHEPKETDQAAIVAAMEAAMTESGLKELVLQSLKAKR